MGDVAVTYKILPQGIDTDMNAIRTKLNQLGAKQVKEQPIAFGLKLIEVLFIIPDKEGPKVEEELRKIPGVASVETESITLV